MRRLANHVLKVLPRVRERDGDARELRRRQRQDEVVDHLAVDVSYKKTNGVHMEECRTRCASKLHSRFVHYRCQVVRRELWLVTIGGIATYCELRVDCILNIVISRKGRGALMNLIMNFLDF